MEVTIDQIIDVGLNVVGFLAAGGLMMLLFSPSRRRDRAPAAKTKPSVAEAPSAGPASPSTARAASFVSLTGSGETPPSSRPPRTASATPGRRDRAEVIRIAREMIAAKRSNREISDRLPISEAELSMLQSGN
jgi:hypothetical protein